MGTAAALNSKTGIVGFIGGVNTNHIQNIEQGYTSGARYINPTIQVLSNFIGEDGKAFNNPEKAFQLSLSQFSSGADVIFHASGASGLGLIDAAVSQNKLMIGIDSDQSLSASINQRPYIITSMIKAVDNVVYNMIGRAMGGSLQGGYYDFGLKESGVGYAENKHNASLLQPIKPILEDVKKKIIEGEIVLPKQIIWH